MKRRERNKHKREIEKMEKEIAHFYNPQDNNKTEENKTTSQEEDCW